MTIATAVERRDRIGTTATAWVARSDIDFTEWVHHGRRLGVIGRGVGWWIGDWLAFGNARYGERYPRAARITGYDVQTLMNMVHVATAVDAERRRADLSWSHHAEVAALPPDEQESWLDFAARHRLSVQALRQEIRASSDEVPQPPETPSRSLSQRSARHAATADSSSLVCPACGHEFAAAADGETPTR